MNRKTDLDHVTCARIPASCLASLAGLRRAEGTRVSPDGDHAWVFWEDGDDRVLRALLPTSGVEFFEKRGDVWHRAGRRLPSFGVPVDVEGIPLSRAVTPSPFSAETPGPPEDRPTPLRLARSGRPRPTSAALCPLVELGRWAELATSAEIESIGGALRGDLALLRGPSLPAWAGATRYWGHRVLVPIGFEPRPNWPEEALVEALEGSARELLRLVPLGDRLGVEAIPLERFRPLSRAGVRIALGARLP